ncbi:TetR/AcrR family transcriptional regulator [Nocardiopsis aegyptia]|uniref:TetR/AcrR family transcriptional regulator n=1 Tax=Nocardiopsis aegyptia TaxID=220378 RepID=UPI00366B2347
MTVPAAVSRSDRASATREAILNAAERLFAEEGLFAVSNRQVSEAAGQGNNAAVGYHFGTKADLVHAIARRHNGSIEARRERMVSSVREADGTRAWLSCLVRPVTDHLAELGRPTWYARFSVQVMADPGYHRMIAEESLSSASLRRVLRGLEASTPHVTGEVGKERREMLRHLVLNVCAARERELAEGEPTRHPTWDDTATGLIDALYGLMTAPVTPSAPTPGT